MPGGQCAEASGSLDGTFMKKKTWLGGMILAAWLIGATMMRRVELVCAVALVLVVELLNTAIEKLADRLTTDHDPQIGHVKDMGSAAVGVTLLLAAAFWLFAIVERMGAI